jgi:hypothetical protein
MSYLTLVQDFCVKRTLPSPSGVVGNTNLGVQQIAMLVREALEDLVKFDFQVLSARTTWTAVAGSDQGAVATLLGPGFDRIASNTLWNQTHMMQFIGPLSPQDWSALQVMPAAGVSYYYTVLGGNLFAWPELAGTETLAAIKTSGYLMTSADGLTYKEVPTADDDLFRIPEGIVRKWLQFKWEQTKGESWLASYEDAMRMVGDHVVATGLPTLQLDRRQAAPRPGVLIPAGSWNV